MAEDNVIQAVELQPADTAAEDLETAKRQDPKDAASSEAEGVNRAMDSRDPDFQQAEVKEKDRLGLARKDPETTNWERKQEADNKNVKAQEKKEKAKEPRYPFNDAEPIFAYYGNDKRTLLFFVLRHPDGPGGQPGPTDTHQIHKSEEHDPAWYWVHKLVGQDEINKNTNKEIDRLNKLRKKDEMADKDRKHKMDQEALFQAKIDAFEMDVIRKTTFRDLKSNIRRSKSIMELTAYVGAIIAMEKMNGTKATD